MSILQGGPELPVFAKPMYDYIATGCYTGFMVPSSEIPDPVLKFVIDKVKY